MVRVFIAAAVLGGFVLGGAATAAADPYYKNCTAARQAGAAPIHQGDPGYGSHLDRDGDGIACE